MNTSEMASKQPEGDRKSSAPSISLPKGGGAIKGIDEKFTVNPATGTGSLNVPIFTSPGRNNFQPQLSLAYNSGTGNGPFGMGWNLSVPSITRKTDKGIPRYLDLEFSDTFILSGADDLVPVLEKSNGAWQQKIDTERPWNGKKYDVHFFRPRIEGLFARIERWTNKKNRADVFWRAITRDNFTSIYGESKEARIVDPADKDNSRIFEWLLERTYDEKGNVIVYKYKLEDQINIQDVETENRESLNAGVYEQNRIANNSAFNQRYLKRIFYGNKTPYYFGDQLPRDDDAYFFEVVFDFGDHEYKEIDPPQNNPPVKHIQCSHSASPHWPCRRDPFSSHRSGFEIRTYRLCRRVLMFHYFKEELGDSPCLVRSTDFVYNENPVATKLIAATQTGYKRSADNASYLFKSFPPIEFRYDEPEINHQVKDVPADSLENLPIGLDNARYMWVDLDGEGISGILTEQAGSWYYKANLGDGQFGPLLPLPRVPVLADLSSGRQQFLDLAGDGQLDLVLLGAPLTGFYERTTDFDWESFRPLRSIPNINLQDPNLRFIDLNGDGHADILITEDQLFVWYPSLMEEGYGPANAVHKALDEEKGPAVVFADGTESIYLADMSGDGLTDIVRIRNGEVCYWPNQGYGRFGAKVTMASPPFFDMPDQFDPKLIRLGDIDGTGTTDIFYLRSQVIRFWYNRSGNSWSGPEEVTSLPIIDNLTAINVVDLLGNGTSCLVWSSPLPGNAARPMCYIDLMGGKKPHLLVNIKNNMGAETELSYASSTKFYLEDKKAGTPWITRLAFPVHVVERIVTHDHVSRCRFISSYSYHHGYYDGIEREFRGFGRVDQKDTEEFAFLEENGLLGNAYNLDKSSHVPPVHTITWFHTGAYIDGSRISKLFENEYYREPSLRITGPNDPDRATKEIAFTAQLLPDTILPDNLTIEEEREACRALKGSMLRQEIYACDNTDKAEHPYTVVEQNFTIRKVQPQAGNRHAGFFTHPREAINYHYERNPIDPRIQHALTLEVDAYGNVLKEAAIGYGRRTTISVVNAQGQVQQVPNPGLAELPEDDQIKQTTALLTYTENRVAGDEGLPNAIDAENDYRTPLPCETVTFELKGYTPTGPDGRFQAADFVEQDPDNDGRLRHIYQKEIGYEESDQRYRVRRPIEWLRTLYRKNDLTGLLPFGELESLALPGETYKLAFTPELLDTVYKRKKPDGSLVDLLPANDRQNILKKEGGYVPSEGDSNWWIPSGRVYYHPNPDTAADELQQARDHFFLAERFTDPFGNSSIVKYVHNLLVATTTDALGNSVQAEYDYRVLQPHRMIDPNSNHTIVAFDALGLVVGTAIQGKVTNGQSESGDDLDDFVADLAQAERDAFFNHTDPHIPAPDLLKDATTRIIYDLECFYCSSETNPEEPEKWQPVYAVTLARESHVKFPPRSGDLKIQISFSYSDGFGREIQMKIQAEPGKVPWRDDDGNIILGPNKLPEMTDHDVTPRWVGSGWTVFNNKGKPVRQFEPFFTDRHGYEFNVHIGVSPYLFYDPVGRVVATLHPNHTWGKMVFDPWQQQIWDVNDTVMKSPETDEDTKGFFLDDQRRERIPKNEYSPTWHALRKDAANTAEFARLFPDPTDRKNETQAAKKTEIHANTPTITHFDSLGRPFLSIANNGKDNNGNDLLYKTWTILDIEGNQRKVVDALGRVVMVYDYYMAGPERDENGQNKAANRIHQASMEAGERWIVNDITGKPIRAWDGRGHGFETRYDRLRRPTEMFVQGENSDLPDQRTRGKRILFEKIEYGEPPTNAPPAEEQRAQQLNLRTRVFQQFDNAGVIVNIGHNPTDTKDESYDFKGNLLRSSRQLAKEYTDIANWDQKPALEDEVFHNSTNYDALNRPTELVAPYSSNGGKKSTIRPIYNDANLLDSIEANIREQQDGRGAPIWTTFVANINYDAKGQRELIEYGNGVTTTYKYDPLIFRLTRLTSTRGVGITCANALTNAERTQRKCPKPGPICRDLQNLFYTYDPAGNITHIRDDAQQTIYFDNQCVEPSNNYLYDAVYRLISASGRDHRGDNKPPSWDDSSRKSNPIPYNCQGIRNYVERYSYDEVGNILEMVNHEGSDPESPGQVQWRRRYQYSTTNNQLRSTSLPGEGEKPFYSDDPLEFYQNTYNHDLHGNIIRMPHLGNGTSDPNMLCDYKDQLRRIDKGGGGEAFYVYDSSGQRVRKVWEKSAGLIEERIYLSGVEIFRKYGGPIDPNAPTMERESLHIMDDKQRIALIETKLQDKTSVVDDINNDPVGQTVMRYQLSNHLGSACLELDGKGEVISYEEYYPYGSTSYLAKNRNIRAAAKRYRYSGKEGDEEGGFYYYGVRYYAPLLGRWCRCDPAGMADSLNLYVFARNNPIILLDNLGYKSERGLQNEYLEPEINQLDPELAPIPIDLSLKHIPSSYDVREIYYQTDNLSISGRFRKNVKDMPSAWVYPDIKVGGTYIINREELGLSIKPIKDLPILKTSLSLQVEENVTGELGLSGIGFGYEKALRANLELCSGLCTVARLTVGEQAKLRLSLNIDEGLSVEFGLAIIGGKVGVKTDPEFVYFLTDIIYGIRNRMFNHMMMRGF